MSNNKPLIGTHVHEAIMQKFQLRKDEATGEYKKRVSTQEALDALFSAIRNGRNQGDYYLTRVLDKEAFRG